MFAIEQLQKCSLKWGHTYVNDNISSSVTRGENNTYVSIESDRVTEMSTNYPWFKHAAIMEWLNRGT